MTVAEGVKLPETTSPPQFEKKLGTSIKWHMPSWNGWPKKKQLNFRCSNFLLVPPWLFLGIWREVPAASATHLERSRAVVIGNEKLPNRHWMDVFVYCWFGMYFYKIERHFFAICQLMFVQNSKFKIPNVYLKTQRWFFWENFSAPCISSYFSSYHTAF